MYRFTAETSQCIAFLVSFTLVSFTCTGGQWERPDVCEPPRSVERGGHHVQRRGSVWRPLPPGSPLHHRERHPPMD